MYFLYLYSGASKYGWFRCPFPPKNASDYQITGKQLCFQGQIVPKLFFEGSSLHAQWLHTWAGDGDHNWPNKSTRLDNSIGLIIEN